MSRAYATERRTALNLPECPPCSGNCNQGRTCPAHDACELPEPLFASSRTASLAVALALTIAAVVVGLCMADIFGRPLL